MDLHSQAKGGQREGGEERSLRHQTPYRSISPSFPLICLSRAGRRDSAHILLQLRDPLSAAPSLKQTHSAHIPLLLCKAKAVHCVNPCQSTPGTARSLSSKLHHTHLHRKKQQQTVCLFSSIAADSKASMCHLLPCANSARCHCRTQTEGVVEG